MQFKKMGLIYSCEGDFFWRMTYAQVPTAYVTSTGNIRIYFSSRDLENRSCITFIEVDNNNFSKVLCVHDKPVLSFGNIGTFDDSGVMPSCIIRNNGFVWMYYIGWNVGTTVAYRNSIGLAVSDDDGISFTKMFDGAIMDRSKEDIYQVMAPFVLMFEDKWLMWYSSGSKWITFKNKTEPFYNIKCATSCNGINWIRGSVCIDYKDGEESGIVRPQVVIENNIYKMWYSYRSFCDYRTDCNKGYKIGYAESYDGANWARKDGESGIVLSDSGWDSEMIAYPNILDFNGNRYMFYNGNGFGKSGFGYAISI